MRSSSLNGASLNGALKTRVFDAMPTFAATFAGARVVIDITPMTPVDVIAREIARKARTATAKSVSSGDDGDDVIWDLIVDNVAVADRDRRTAFRLMNFKPTTKFEVRQRACASASVGAEAVKVKPAVAAAKASTSVGRDAAASAPVADDVVVNSGVAIGREYRVIRRAVEIDEGPGAPPEEVPDEFFELTVADAVAMSKRSTAEPILMTKKMRENAAKEKKRPTHAIIRFLAPPPSDLIIEGLFGADESARAMYDFIAKFARSPAVAAAMEVFVTPPKRIFARSDATTLIDAGLAPAARVRVGVKAGSTTYNSGEDAERALFSDQVIAQACGPVKKTVRPTPEATTKTEAVIAEASVPPNAEEKKQKLMDKLKAGGKPKWLKF